MSIGTLYYSHSTNRVSASFQSMPFYDASITHNHDKASSMSFKSNLKLEEADRIIYKNVDNKKIFGGQVVKRSKTLGGDYTYEVVDYKRLYQSKISCSESKITSSNFLKKLLKNNPNKLSTSGIQSTSYIHTYLKWDNVSLWTIVEQLAWLEYKAGNYIYYDIDYAGGLIWKKIPEQVTGYTFSEAYDYEDSHDSSDIITRGAVYNSNSPSQHVDAWASDSMIAKWGYVTELTSCTPPSSNKNNTGSNCSVNSTAKLYWTKCGVSPDKKSVVAVAKPSSADANKYSYKLYRTVFKNYCPNCKKKGYLRFDGGKKTKCITSQKDGWGYKPSVRYEHEITCVHCDSDYCGVTGLEKSHGHISRLKTIKKPVRSSQSEFNKLTSGKLVYSQGTTSKCDTKKINASSLRNEANIKKYNIDSSVVNQALAVTSPKKSTYQNAKAIFNWVKNNTRYEGYSNTRYGAAGTLKRRKGNCTDHGHLMCAMNRAVGIKCNYIHNRCIHHVYNKVYINGKGVIVDTGRHNPSWGSHWGGSGCPVEKTKLDF